GGRGSRHGACGTARGAAAAVGAGILAASNYFGSVAGTLIYYAEIGRSLAWILALSSIAGAAAPRWLSRAVMGIGVLLLLGPFIAPYFIWLGLLPDDSTLLLARAG